MTTNPTERPEERDLLSEFTEHLSSPDDDINAGYHHYVIRTLINEVHGLELRVEQMEEALREAETRTDIAPKDWDRWGHVVRHRIAEAHDILRAALSPSDTEEEA